MNQVFISYRKTERALAEEFKKRIEKTGFQVWMDTKLHAGTEWRDAIDQEIRKSIAVVVLLTPDAKSSEYVTYEWAFAYGAGVRVIPAIYINPADLHPRMSGLQYLMFGGARRPWNRLIKALKDAEKISPLKIHSAVWGPKKNIYDVTKKVQRKVRRGRVKMQANRDVFQDPLHGEKKVLFVYYSNQNSPAVEEVLEHEDLSIP
jgi:TIR domain